MSEQIVKNFAAAYRQIEYKHDEVIEYIKSVVQKQYLQMFPNPNEIDFYTLDAGFYTSAGDKVGYNTSGVVVIGEDSYEVDWEDLALDDIMQIIGSESFQQWANIPDISHY